MTDEELLQTFDLEAAHIASMRNRKLLKKDKKCGCFYCLKIFSPTEIKEWIPESRFGKEVTAICPYCGLDTILAEISNYPITDAFLRLMHKRWFNK